PGCFLSVTAVPLVACEEAGLCGSVVTDAGDSPALGTDQRLGDEGQSQRDDLVRRLGVQVVTGTLDDHQLAEALGQVGDDALALGARVGPIGVGAALNYQDRA